MDKLMIIFSLLIYLPKIYSLEKISCISKNSCLNSIHDKNNYSTIKKIVKTKGINDFSIKKTSFNKKDRAFDKNLEKILDKVDRNLVKNFEKKSNFTPFNLIEQKNKEFSNFQLIKHSTFNNTNKQIFKNEMISNSDAYASENFNRPAFLIKENSLMNQTYLFNASSLPLVRNKVYDDIYENFKNVKNDDEKIDQINAWLTDSIFKKGTTRKESNGSKKKLYQNNVDDLMISSDTKIIPDYADYDESTEPPLLPVIKNSKKNLTSIYDNSEMSGTLKTPPCASKKRFYCSFKEDYPNKVVSEVTKYYKWPLEKLFKDLRQQVMPKLANDNYGALVCDSVTRVIRPGWARNTANKWLVVINTESYQQYVTEVICRHGPETNCNFIPPCYQANCKQRFNTQKLLVIDPWNPYKGPFLSEFLFASCCVCYIPEFPNNSHPMASSIRSNTIDKKSNKINHNIKNEF